MSNIRLITFSVSQQKVLHTIISQAKSFENEAREVMYYEKLGKRLLANGFENIIQRLSCLIKHNGEGVLLLDLSDNLTGRPIPPTPTRRDAYHGLLDIDKLRVALIGAAKGISYGYDTQANGLINNDVVFLPQALSSVYSTSTDKIDWHTEAFMSVGGKNEIGAIYDGLSFAFLRNKNNVPTFLSSADFNNLDKITISQLSKKQFCIPCNEATLLTSILHLQPDGTYFITVNFMILNKALAQYSAAQVKALSRLHEFLDERKVSINCNENQILFFDNLRVVHSRPAAIVRKSDPEGRWQRRAGFGDCTRAVLQDQGHMINRVIIFERLMEKLHTKA